MKPRKKKYVFVIVSVICAFIILILFLILQLSLKSKMLKLEIYDDNAKAMLESELKIELTDNTSVKNISLMDKSFSNTDTLFALLYVAEDEINILLSSIEQSAYELRNDDISILEDRTNKKNNNYLDLNWWFNSYSEIDRLYVSSSWPLSAIYISKIQNGFLKIYIEKETKRSILQNEYGIEIK